MIKFVFPYAFLLLPLPVLFRLFVPAVKKAKGLALRMPFYNKIKNIRQKSLKYFYKFSLEAFVLYGVWSLLVLSIARPVLTSEPITLKPKGRVLMLALDASFSMARPDFMIKSVPRTRLDVAKFVISDFIEKRKGDRVGLIAFGTRPFLISPPTYDIKTLSRLLSETKIGMAGSKTSIGDAIAKAVKTLENTKSNSRVLVLLSDGANRIGNIGIDEAIRVAKSINLKIYAIAIGAKNMKEILPNGKVRYTKSSDLNIDILKKIANQTGGKLYIANSTNNLKLNYDKINKLEPIDDKEIYLKPQKELFYIPLLGVLLVLFLYFIRVLISKFKNNNRREDNV